jgi:FdhD protein
MEIRDHYKQKETVRSAKVLIWEPGRETVGRQIPVLSEHLLEIRVNGAVTVNVVCVAEHLTDLILGRLLTEGFISGVKDVESVEICRSGAIAEVVLRNGDPEVRPLRPVGSLQWEPRWVLDLAEEFEKDTPLHMGTRSTHSCFLALRGELVTCCEDIGRHNAMDKAVGYCLTHDIDPGQVLVYSSGRIPMDMAVKAIRAGIPVVATKEAATYEAAELAAQYGLTLVCNAKRGRMNIYPPADICRI